MYIRICFSLFAYAGVTLNKKIITYVGETINSDIMHFENVKVC